MSHDLDTITRFYAQKLAEHGDGPRAVGWETAHGQQAAFLQLARIDGLESGARVLDLGCGLGHLLDFFEARGLEVEYTGYDISAPLIERARELHPGARFEQRDILSSPPAERFDVVLASGLFGVAPADPVPFIVDMLHAMFELCERSVGFNMLSNPYVMRHPMEAIRETYYYADPDHILGACLGITAQVSLDHAGIGDQFAVFMYRDHQRSALELIEHLGIGPDDPFGPAHQAVIEHFSTLGLRRQAIAFLESLTPSLPILDAIGYLGFELRDEALQLDAWTRACDLEPGSAVPWTRLATVHADAGRLHDTVACLERALALAPDDDAIRRRLAGILG